MSLPLLRMAEASGSRTHRRRANPPPAGFEDREDHRTPCASGLNQINWQGTTLTNGQREHVPAATLPPALRHFRPGVFQCDGAVEHQTAGCGVEVNTEISQALELVSGAHSSPGQRGFHLAA